jgi:hypothetical protein
VCPKWFALSTVPCTANTEGAISGAAAHVVLFGGVPQWFVRFVVGVAPVVCPDQTEPERSVLGRPTYRSADGRVPLLVTSGWPTPQPTTETRRGVGLGVGSRAGPKDVFSEQHTHRRFRFHATMLRSLVWLKLAASAAALFNFTHTQYGTSPPFYPSRTSTEDPESLHVQPSDSHRSTNQWTGRLGSSSRESAGVRCTADARREGRFGDR